jgi:hypothetical protein
MSIAPSFMSSAFDSGGLSIPAAGPSARSQFQSSIDNQSWAETVKSINGLNAQGGLPGRYVLAQIYTRQKKIAQTKEVIGPLNNDPRAVANAGAKPQILYAIEVSAFGKATSQMAASYETNSLRDVAIRQSRASFFGGIGFVLALVSTLFGGFWQTITRRVERVRKLAESNDFVIGEIELPDAVAEGQA